MSSVYMTNPFAKSRFYEVVGVTIRAARVAAGLTQDELATRAKLPQSAVHNAENGALCSLLVMALIAEALDVAIDELVPTEATS